MELFKRIRPERERQDPRQEFEKKWQQLTYEQKAAYDELIEIKELKESELNDRKKLRLIKEACDLARVYGSSREK